MFDWGWIFSNWGPWPHRTSFLSKQPQAFHTGINELKMAQAHLIKARGFQTWFYLSWSACDKTKMMTGWMFDMLPASSILHCCFAYSGASGNTMTLDMCLLELAQPQFAAQAWLRTRRCWRNEQVGRKDDSQSVSGWRKKSANMFKSFKFVPILLLSPFMCKRNVKKCTLELRQCTATCALWCWADVNLHVYFEKHSTTSSSSPWTWGVYIHPIRSHSMCSTRAATHVPPAPGVPATWAVARERVTLRRWTPDLLGGSA